jgi:hypothetical protein
MPQLGSAFTEADQSLVRALESKIQEPDADALLNFSHGPLGVSYLQFLDDMRSVHASAVRSVVGHMHSQTPISQAGDGPAVMQMRLRLITLASGAASVFLAQDAARDTHDPAPFAANGIRPEQIAALRDRVWMPLPRDTARRSLISRHSTRLHLPSASLRLSAGPLRQKSRRPKPRRMTSATPNSANTEPNGRRPINAASTTSRSSRDRI